MTFGFNSGNNSFMVEIQEAINVWVLFEKNLIKPHLFFWRNRQIKIDKINLVHTSKNGQNLFYHFSVSSGGNFYKLKFDVKKMKWFLEAVEEE